MMRKTKAFTLIELLVVIAIIALLMAILMPTLARVRKQARAVVCQSNLHQWGHSILMYTSDNNYYFMKGWMWQVSDFWIDALRPYYANEPKLRCCPTAKKTWTEGGSSTFSAWGKFGERELALPGWASKGDYGSYGINEWVYHPPPEIKTGIAGRPRTYNWRTMNVKGASEIPLFLDCFWVGGEALADDPPPPFDGVELIFGEEMKFFCLNRHNGTTNGVFMDGRVRKIGLKELWDLKWHRNWEEERKKAGTPVWPEWMRDF